MGYTQKKHFPITAQPTMITYRLAGSVPVKMEEYLIEARNLKLEKLWVEVLKHQPAKRKKFLEENTFRIHGEHELAIEKLMHTHGSGPYHLQRPELQKIIMDSWAFLHDKKAIFLVALCVMGNHVHVIVKSPEHLQEILPGKLMQRHKAHTAKACNTLLGKTGEPLWHNDYHDRAIRAGKFISAMYYLLNNPVKAGLVNTWAEWPGTYVHPDYVGLFR